MKKQFILIALAAFTLAFASCQKDVKVAPTSAASPKVAVETAVLNFDEVATSSQQAFATTSLNSKTATPSITITGLQVTNHGDSVIVKWLGKNLFSDSPLNGTAIFLEYIRNGDTTALVPAVNIGTVSFYSHTSKKDSILIDGLGTANDGVEKYGIAGIKLSQNGKFFMIAVGPTPTHDGLMIQATDQATLRTEQPKECMKASWWWN